MVSLYSTRTNDMSPRVTENVRKISTIGHRRRYFTRTIRKGTNNDFNTKHLVVVDVRSFENLHVLKLGTEF